MASVSAPIGASMNVLSMERHKSGSARSRCSDKNRVGVNTVVRGHRLDLLEVDVELSSEGSGDGRLTPATPGSRTGPVVLPLPWRGLSFREVLGIDFVGGVALAGSDV
jgi:hypothetical protein